MISLADLRARNVLPTWQEAVAIVQELLHAVVATQGSADRLPDLEHVALIPNGDVVALPGSPAPGHPVRHLAILLQLLLEGVPVPPELQSFIENNVTNPPQFSTVEEFSKQLAFFERPGRKSDVERLVARANMSDAQTRADEELRRLKEKAQAAAEKQEASEEAPEKKRQRRGVPVAVIAVAVILATIAAAAVGWWQREQAIASSARSQVSQVAGDDAKGTGSNAASNAAADKSGAASASPGQPSDSSKAGSLLDRTRDAVSRVVHRAMEKISGAPAPAVEAAAPVDKAPKPASPKRSRSRREGEVDVAARAAAPGAGVSVSATEVAGSVAPPSLAASIPTSVPSEVPDIIYMPGDPGVEPAVMVRPVLPKQPPPDVPPDKIGTLEVIVDEEGNVEQVKLISPANRYHERMLVSAAKMWKFRPAMKDGHPVRYKATVRLTI